MDVSSHKSKNHSEDTFRSLLKEADALKITNSEVQKLRQHIEEAEQWKRRVVMFLEDEREQIERKEVFHILLRETALFKFELDLSKVVQKRFEFIEWKEKVTKVWKVMHAGDQPVEEGGMHVP